jgi:uncharacterized protein YjiS (DUF1127 family)
MSTTAISAANPCRPSTPRPISDVLLRYLKRAAARRDLRDLTAAQLRDVGIDPSVISDGPVCEVEASTMVRLMSLS